MPHLYTSATQQLMVQDTSTSQVQEIDISEKKLIRLNISHG